MSKLVKKWWLAAVWIGLFVVTRMYIWINKPVEFSQITYVYMPYAHLWADGYLPYLKQWYEYPPWTIPIFYIPHLIDMTTNNTAVHIDYGNAYRGQMLLMDILIFGIIWKYLIKLKIERKVITLSLGYYSVVTAKAHDFIYDAFDLAFIGPVVVGLAAFVLWQKKNKLIYWVTYMLAVAIKYINAPLALVRFSNQRHDWKKNMVLAGLAFGLIWSLPLILFRSSMLVTLEYHKQRGIQVESFPATISRSINVFTHSEKFVEVSKAYDIQGPVSQIAYKVFKVIFPCSLLFFVLFVSWQSYHINQPEYLLLEPWIVLAYICLFMVTSTVLSTPYLLWHIPLVAMLPVNNFRLKLELCLVSMIIVAAGMTKIPDGSLFLLSTHIWIGYIKMVGFSWIFFRSMQFLRRRTSTTR